MHSTKPARAPAVHAPRAPRRCRSPAARAPAACAPRTVPARARPTHAPLCFARALLPAVPACAPRARPAPPARAYCAQHAVSWPCSVLYRNTAPDLGLYCHNTIFVLRYNFPTALMQYNPATLLLPAYNTISSAIHFTFQQCIAIHQALQAFKLQYKWAVAHSRFAPEIFKIFFFSFFHYKYIYIYIYILLIFFHYFQ